MALHIEDGHHSFFLIFLQMASPWEKLPDGPTRKAQIAALSAGKIKKKSEEECTAAYRSHLGLVAGRFCTIVSTELYGAPPWKMSAGARDFFYRNVKHPLLDDDAQSPDYRAARDFIELAEKKKYRLDFESCMIDVIEEATVAPLLDLDDE